MTPRWTPCAPPAARAGGRSPRSRRAIREQTGIAALKIRHNNVLGYHIEVPARHADKLMAADIGLHPPPDARRRGPLQRAGPARAGDPRRPGRGACARSRGRASRRADRRRRSTRAEPVAATADALARLDVAAALAERAAEGGWCRPNFADDAMLRRSRPVAIRWSRRRSPREGDALRRQRLPPCRGSRLWLVTGPNMGGKSTFLRQNALIVVLAQAGSYVPASRATLGLVDRLFSRVGASDNLARGRSTFMVEMVETAAILAQATARSFVILDEVGRGTSTYDGLAIAWAVVEAIHDTLPVPLPVRDPLSRADPARRAPRRAVAPPRPRARMEGRAGAAPRSRRRARRPQLRHRGRQARRTAAAGASRAPDAVLGKLEQGRAATGGHRRRARRSAAVRRDRGRGSRPRIRCARRSEEVEPDRLSPREALDFVYRLKRLESGES